MLIGHVAVGLAAKPLAPKASLGSLMVASVAIDTLCGVFMLTGIESVDAATGTSSIPWSHGLFMAAVWSLAGFARIAEVEAAVFTALSQSVGAAG
jgi:hypothetical protein